MICAHPPGLDISLISCHSWASSPGEVARADPPHGSCKRGAGHEHRSRVVLQAAAPFLRALARSELAPSLERFFPAAGEPGRCGSAGAAVPVRWSRCGGPSAEPGERYLEGERLPSALSLPALAARARTTKARAVTWEPCARADRGNAARYFPESISCSSVASGTGLAGRRSAECHNSNAPNITSSPLFCASQCSELRVTRLGHRERKVPVWRMRALWHTARHSPGAQPPLRVWHPLGTVTGSTAAPTPSLHPLGALRS